MGIDLTYSFADAERWLKKAQNALSPQELQTIGFQAGSVVGVDVESFLRQYPPSPNGRPLPRQYVRTRSDGSTYLSKFKTAGSQGYYFGVIVKQGRVPYKRTGELGRSVFHAVDVNPDGSVIVVRVGASAPHSIYVIGEKQNIYHTITGWRQIGDVLEAEKERLQLRFGQVYGQLLRRKLT